MAEVNQEKLELFTYIRVERFNGKNVWRRVGLVRCRRMDWNWRARLSYVLCYWPRLSQSFLNQPPGGGYTHTTLGGGGGNGKKQKLMIQKSWNFTGGLFDMTKNLVINRSSNSIFVPKLAYIFKKSFIYTKNIAHT